MLTAGEFGRLWAEAGEVAVTRYIRKRWGYALSLEEVEDLTQATALRAWGARGGFTPQDAGAPATSFVSWLFSVANSAGLDFFRAAMTAKASNGVRPVPLDGPAYFILDPSDEYREVDDEAVVAGALELLPSTTYRETMALWWEGLEYDEIGERTGVGRGTVSSRLYKGRRILRGHREKLMGVGA